MPEPGAADSSCCSVALFRNGCDEGCADGWLGAAASRVALDGRECAATLRAIPKNKEASLPPRNGSNGWTLLYLDYEGGPLVMERPAQEGRGKRRNGDPLTGLHL